MVARPSTVQTMTAHPSPTGDLRLRPVRVDDIAWMAEMRCDPELVGEHNWAGVPRDLDEVTRELHDRFAVDGFFGTDDGWLVAEVGTTPIGDLSWRPERWGPSARSVCPAFGIALLPEHRGKGYGSTAQRLLLDYLFERDPSLHRVQSDTAADNPAEQRALAKAGMVLEGTVRDVEYRNGTYHDHLVYGILRAEWENLP